MCTGKIWSDGWDWMAVIPPFLGLEWESLWMVWSFDLDYIFVAVCSRTRNTDFCLAEIFYCACFDCMQQ